MATIKQAYGLDEVRAYTPKNLDPLAEIKIESKELVGIEVEVENVRRLHYLNDVWSHKQDSSLRNGGAEFVSQPIPACYAPDALHNLMTRSLDNECCFSPRTSVHVHLNFCHNDTEDVMNLVLLYAVFERLFFRFVGRSRIKNIYCVPITETDLIVHGAIRGLRPDRWQKYAGLNLKPLAEYGTVEFRHMHGTQDVRKLSVWVDLITKLKEYCLKQGASKLRETIARMDDSFDFAGLLKEVFGSTAEYLKYESLDDVKFTYPVAKTLLTRGQHINLISRTISSTSPYFSAKVD